MGAIQNDWLEAIGDEFKKPYYKELYQFVKDEYSTTVIFRPQTIFLMRCILRRLTK